MRTRIVPATMADGTGFIVVVIKDGSIVFREGWWRTKEAAQRNRRRILRTYRRTLS